MRRRFLILTHLLLVLLVALPAAAQDEITCTFRNPLTQFGQDPSVVFHEGMYYMVQSENDGDPSILLYQSPTITGLASVDPVTIYAPPQGEIYSRNVWAPELVYLQDAWYVYYAADDGNNDQHRTYALRTEDINGAWEFMGAVFRTPELDVWSIDFVAFEYGDSLYGVWSGSDVNAGAGASFPQVLYIAEMSDPMTVISDRVKIHTPTEPWETSVAAIAEGPQPFIYDDQLTIVYSADASWSREYKLGAITLTGDDPLDPEAWTQLGVVYEGYENENGAVYGVGHNASPVTSPDGSEWWLVYHAKAGAADGWGDRDLRAQEFTWNDDGTPNLGIPAPLTQTLAVPEGEPCGLVTEYNFDDSSAVSADTFVGDVTLTDGALVLNDAYVDFAMPYVNTTGSYTVAAEISADDADPTGTILSQTGGLFSAFMLRVTPDGLEFAVNGTDGNVAASALAPVSFDEPVHVVGVRDALNNEILLYIDGELAAEAPLTDTWGAVSSFVIGASKARAQFGDFFNGTVDDVVVFNGALNAEAIAELAEASN